MKILLIGHYPPPHGGISVHVLNARAQLSRAGIPCRVLNLDRYAPPSEEYLRFRGPLDLALQVFRHGVRGWTLHVHTNGHNFKSWMVALICGIAGRPAPSALLTLHSGDAPGYLRGAAWRRLLARLACRFYTRVIAVNPDIRRAVLELRTEARRVDLLPAFLPATRPAGPPPAEARAWMREHRPVLSTALSFRPEYGFDVLVNAIALLRKRYPQMGCLVMGTGEGRSDAELLIQHESLENAFLLLGDVDHTGCLAVMSHSDLFVRTTLTDGDAISVREALSLGVPVVASDIGTRPAGTVLFRKGDIADLVAKVEVTLERRTGPEPLPRAEISGGAQRLLEIYSEVGA